MPVVDIHTHVYPPTFVSLLRSRTSLPRIHDGALGPRLIILPSDDDPSKPEDERGRPLGPDYHDIARKLAFMDTHGIDISVISLANPWIDFLPPASAAETARTINDDVETMCAAHSGRLFAFGTLPLSAPTDQIAAEVGRLSSLKHMRGVIMGTSGLGAGLDDLALDPVYASLEQHQSVVFLHPHYGLPNEVFGPRASEYGHVLPLALGFPVETTIAVARMLLSGVFERFPNLKVLLAHSGGTLPFLAGRIESCILHDGDLKKHGKVEKISKITEVLKRNIYLDAVIYSDIGLKAAIDASGADRLLFGTDHPFFPPLDGEEQWLSVTLNTQAVEKACGKDKTTAQDVLGNNAVRILRLG